MKLEEFENYMLNAFHLSSDLLTRKISVAGKDCVFSFIDGESDKELLQRDVILPLMNAGEFGQPYKESIRRVVNFSEEIEEIQIKDAPATVAEGDVVFFPDGNDKCYVISLRKFNMRSISEPPTESVLKGSREGFIEEIKTNVTLIRRRVKSPDLVIKMLSVGKYSSTSVALAYVDGIASPEVVEDLLKKISAIDIDGIVDSTYIADFIVSHKYSMFVQTGSSEKPDIVSAKLLEGRVAILVDGSPIVITVPYLIFEDLQDSYDYYSNSWRASMIRFVRIFGAFFTIMLPGAYVALQSFHFHLLPIKFLITLMSATKGIPFPPAIEMLVALILFEILNQASIRMPRYMGISLSIVGTIVLGDTAVNAGLISLTAVLIIALSAIGIFCVPDQVGTLGMLRFIFLLASAVLGFLGMIVVLIAILCYLTSLENFGTPYLAPYAPRINPDLKDGFFKSSATEMKKRPYSIPTDNRVRLRNDAFKDIN